MNISTFSEVVFNKCSALGILNTSQCPVMLMVFFFSTDKCNYTVIFFGISLAKQRKQNSPTRILLHSVLDVHNTVCAKISKRIDSFILLWWKRESNAKNDTWPHPISWSGFCFKCCQKELFSSWFLMHLLCCFSRSSHHCDVSPI